MRPPCCSHEVVNKKIKGETRRDGERTRGSERDTYTNTHTEGERESEREGEGRRDDPTLVPQFCLNVGCSGKPPSEHYCPEPSVIGRLQLLVRPESCPCPGEGPTGHIVCCPTRAPLTCSAMECRTSEQQEEGFPGQCVYSGPLSRGLGRGCVFPKMKNKQGKATRAGPQVCVRMCACVSMKVPVPVSMSVCVHGCACEHKRVSVHACVWWWDAVL